MAELIIALYSDDSSVRSSVKAVPEGGMGVARQLKDEVFNCPPVLLITGRVQDNWLAAWSKAEATTSHPIDPFNLAAKCAALLKADSALAK